MWVGEVGQSGINAIGKLLNGTVNPSGKLVDTHCYDDLTSPTLQNAHVTSCTNAEAMGLAFAGTCNEYYVVYQEGIYVGYRYYETRYEDAVLGNPNVGDYDYASTVAHSFGYSLSYSTFEYKNMTLNDLGDTLQFTVEVTNTSDIDGAEVVEIFMQSPYTDYDRANGVEKASVELVGYQKVAIAAGETVSVNVDVDKTELRAFDAYGADTYILYAGNYYFAAGNGAHDALNNILAAKAALRDESNGIVDPELMIDEGNEKLAVQYVVKTQDNDIFATAVTSNAITVQLDHADLNRFDADKSNDIVYLTRSDWQGTMPNAELTSKVYKAAVQIATNDDMLKDLNYTYESSTQGSIPTI